ncbi:MAG: hypothetical protein KDB07_09500, partial [Planctomycetes bacterium]|nr:hypothetical protein [Planctomycetota bacterium]
MSEPSPRLAPPSELLRGLSAYRAMLLRRRFARVALVCSWALASGFGLGLIGLAFGLASFPIVAVSALIAGASALVVGLRRWPAPSVRDAALHGEAHSRAQGALALALEAGSVLLCSVQVEQALGGLKEAESRRPPLFPNLFPVFASLLSVVLLGSGLLVVWAAEIELIDLGPAPSAQATSETPSRRAQPTLNAEAMEELRASLLRKPAADASKAFQEQALREISVAAEKSKRRQEAAKEVLEALDANDAEKLREAKSALSAAISDNESQTLAESTDSALRELAEQVLRESEST